MSQLTQDMLDFLETGVSHQIGACTDDGRPVLCRGVGAMVEPDGRLVVILSSESGHEVLAAVAQNGRISVNLTQPQTYKSLNFAGRDAAISPAGAAFRALVDKRHAAFRTQLEPLGFRPEYTAAWHSPPDNELMAIRFTPITARNQTPGPGAGNALELRPR